ncbi:hypothetical protein ES703_20868 [subsurface metagenome]
MIVHKYLDIPPTEDAPGVLRRVVIGPDEGAPRFIMRVFHVEPGCSTPFHSHWWEHEVFVLEGDGVVKSREDESKIGEGMVVFIAPNEEHCFTNTGNGVLRFICVIPLS